MNMPAMPKFFALKSAMASINAMPGLVRQVARPAAARGKGCELQRG